MKKFLAILLVCLMVIPFGVSFAEEDGRVTITVAIFDRGAVPANQGSYEDNWVTRYINKNAPVKVEFVPVPRWEAYTTYNLWLASDMCVDVIMEFQPEFVQEWSSEGVLYELGDLIDQYAPNYRAMTSEEVQSYGFYNGGEYAMVDTRAETNIINFMSYIRTDWLENLGLSMPTSFDELKEVIRAFTEDDPDGNGVDDTYGWNFSQTGQSIIQNMMGVNAEMWVIENGEFVDGYVSNAMLEAYKFLEEIYDNDWADVEYLTDTSGTKAFGDFMSGKLGIINAGSNCLVGSGLWKPLIESNPNAKVAAMPSFTEYGYYQERACNFLNCIPATSEHPEAAVQYLDWMLSEGWKTVQYGIEGEDFVYDGDEIVRLTTEEQYAEKFSYTQEYATMTPYKMNIARYRSTYEAYDDSDPIKAAYLIQADAMEETKDIRFNRVLPVNNPGLSSYNELMPDMDALAVEYWAKALNNKDYTAEQALADIKAEWASMGYEEVKADYNAKAREMGYLD